MNKEQFQKFLEEEQKKIEKADQLLADLKSQKFWLFNPKYWKKRKELSKVIKSFNLIDINYNVILPELK